MKAIVVTDEAAGTAGMTGGTEGKLLAIVPGGGSARRDWGSAMTRGLSR
jgi:hypothetical protein